MTETLRTSPAEPIFLGWDKPALPTAAERIADVYAGAGGLDLRGVLIVTPGARAGRRLMELLLEEAERDGVPLPPPDTVTIGRFPERLYTPTGPLADSTVTRHAFAQALKKTDPGLLGDVFPELAPNLAGWMALAGIVEKLHREVGAEGKGFLDVARAFEAGLPYDDSNRWEILAEVQKTYLKLLRESGYRDRDRDRRLALEEGRVSAPGDIWMIGVVEVGGVVRNMVESLSGQVRALVHAPEELREGFDSLRCFLPHGWKEATIPLENEQLHVVQRPRDQASAVTGVLRGLGGRFAAEEIVVGAPDPELVPFVEQKDR